MVGIIAEYNPFHNGHLYHLNKVKEMFKDKVIVLVLAGNFLNRGDISIIDKWDKTKLALLYGVDLVLELPTFYATQSADIYAFGAISILNHLKCEYIVFGSETNDINVLTKIANTNLDIKKYLKKGLNYPTSLGKAFKDEMGININNPNDLLGISYIKAINKLNSNIIPVTIKRTNNYHSLKLDKICSATSIRKAFKDNTDIKPYVPSETLNYIQNIDLNDYFDIIKYKIITDDLTRYIEIDESLNNLFKKYINTSNNIEQLINGVKFKNNTYNKIKRCLVHILLNITKDEIPNIDYIRILGFNDKGKKYLNKIKKDIKVPLISKYDERLNFELKVSLIYGLKGKTKDEIKQKIII